MEILKILETSEQELLPEDLDFFETELATGDYTDGYITECTLKLQQIRRWMNGEEETDDNPADASTGKKKSRTPMGLVLGLGDVAPKGTGSVMDSMTPEQIILHDINTLRELDAYKTRFKKYTAQKAEIDEAFIERHFSFFSQWELNAIISVKQMSEDFLEKYFGALDHDKIARYQRFSEAFFMKHYTQLDASIVLEHGKNEWRKKENRSRQLDVFLRLKGVKI